MRLANKVAVVTGGGSGIGLAAAGLFLEEGAEVAILGRDEAKLRAAAESLDGRPLWVRCDVSRPEALCGAAKRVEEWYGGVDVLFANAGLSEAPDLLETSEADFDAMIGTNVKGAFFAITSFLPLMRDGGSIVLTGSVAGRKGRPGDPLYALSKGAVRSFGRTLAMDEGLLARRIRVNVLTPGPIRTPLVGAAVDDPEIHDYVAAMVPMGRWGEAREAAEAVLFLASDASSFVTGAEITVDGGLAHV